jgi:multidrug efflux pump subunit AcrB
MEFPFVGVTVELEGASPSALEDEVVDPLEESFATIEGVRHIHSEATGRAARVMLEFELEHDLDTAAQDVRDKLNASDAPAAARHRAARRWARPTTRSSR